MEYYLVISLAIPMLMFEKFEMPSVKELCAVFIDSLQKWSPDMDKNTVILNQFMWTM